jgi:hypothetical protein
VNEELERIPKKEVVANFKFVSRHLRGEAEENYEQLVRITGLRSEI